MGNFEVLPPYRDRHDTRLDAGRLRGRRFNFDICMRVKPVPGRASRIDVMKCDDDWHGKAFDGLLKSYSKRQKYLSFTIA